MIDFKNFYFFTNYYYYISFVIWYRLIIVIVSHCISLMLTAIYLLPLNIKFHLNDVSINWNCSLSKWLSYSDTSFPLNAHQYQIKFLWDILNFIEWYYIFLSVNWFPLSDLHFIIQIFHYFKITFPIRHVLLLL